MKSKLVIPTLMLTFGLAAYTQTAYTQTTNSPKVPTNQTTTFTTAQHKHVRLLLSAHHQLPAKAHFEKVSPNVQMLLLDVASSNNIFEYHRLRALEALGMYWKDQKAFALYGTLLADSKTKEGTKHRLMMMSTKYYGAQGLVHIKGFIDHKDLQLRWTAAVAAMALDKKNKAVCDLLSPRLTKEKQVNLKNKIRIYLGEIK